jgi:hypothetical protein
MALSSRRLRTHPFHGCNEGSNPSRVISVIIPYMNIFYLDNDPSKCARMHCDRHVVKMILEYTQLLSTAHRLHDGKQSIVLVNNRKLKRWTLENPRMNTQLFLASHINHPSAVWARETEDQYAWLYRLLTHLCKEYTHRYEKTHSVVGRCWDELRNPPVNLKGKKGFREPPQAMPEEYKVVGDSITAYKNYYNGAKRRFATWKNRNVPEWWIINTVPNKEVQNAVL